MSDDPLANDPWLTLAEIAEDLRVNPATVRLWVSKGQLKASRAGMRKWIVRRSDLERMLATTNSPPDEVLDRLEPGEPVADSTPSRRRPRPNPEQDSEPTAHTVPRRARSGNAVELLRLAVASYEGARNDCVLAPPSPGYVGRLLAIADSSEHLATTMRNAAETAGIRWRSQTGMEETLPYELSPVGNRPGPPELWEHFDAAFDRLVLTATGTEILAVAQGYDEISETLRAVAAELHGDEDWQIWERQAQ